MARVYKRVGCSAPSKSSHLSCLLPELVRTPVPSCLMRPRPVVPVHPVSDEAPRVVKPLKLMLPDTLLLQTAKEPLDEAISATDVSLLRMLRTSAARRFAVHRSMGSTESWAMATSSVRYSTTSEKWSQLRVEQDTYSSSPRHSRIHSAVGVSK